MPEEDIGGDTMRDAARLVGYFKSHARKVHHVMGTDPVTDDAAKVLGWIKRTNQPTFDQRDAQRGPLQRKSAEDVGAALKILIDHGYIRPRPVAPQTGGRPPSPSFEVNPAILTRG